MGLRFDPVGGGQFKAAVQQIIEAERQPIKSIEARKVKEDARLKLFQEFKSKFNNLDKILSDIGMYERFRELKAELGEGENLMSVSLDKTRAEPGQYEIEIDELATRTSGISNGFEDPNEAVFGSGFITMENAEGETVEVYVDEKHSSLYGIAAAINKAKNSLIRASVVKDAAEPDTPWKLIVSGKQDGEAHQIAYPEFYFTG